MIERSYHFEGCHAGLFHRSGSSHPMTGSTLVVGAGQAGLPVAVALRELGDRDPIRSSPEEWCIGVPSRRCLEGWLSGLDGEGFVSGEARIFEVIRPGRGSSVVVPESGLVAEGEHLQVG